MTYATDTQTKQSLDSFQQYDVDTQLALLWYGYLDIKEQLQPQPGASVTAPSDALYDQFKSLPAEEQLQAQRDILARKETPLTHTYNALASSAKLQLWLSLAQGMEEGTIVPVPQDYQLPEATHPFVEAIQQLDFEQRINFMRSAVVEMGAPA